MKTIKWAVLEITCCICGKKQEGIIGEFIRDGWIIDKFKEWSEDSQDRCSIECHKKWCHNLELKQEREESEKAHKRLVEILGCFDYGDIPTRSKEVIKAYSDIEDLMREYLDEDYGQVYPEY